MIDIKDLAWQAVNHYGMEHQMGKAVEEMGELITELARYQDGRTNGEKIAEEVADCFITLFQLRWMCGADIVDKAIERKAERLRDRMKGD